MPTKVIKKNSVFLSFLCTSFNSSIKTSKFPQCLKLADITPLYKTFVTHFRKIYCTEYGALYLKIKTKME